MDPKSFGTEATLLSEVERLAGAIAGLPPAQGVEAVRLPGERGYALSDERLTRGIPLVGGTARRLVEEARKRRVDVPKALS